MGIWVLSRFAMNISLYMCFCGHKFSFLLGKYLGMELLNHRLGMFHFYQTVLQVVVPFYTSVSIYERSVVSHPHQQLVLSVFVF